MSQFKAVVKKVVSKEINIGGKPMMKNEITVDVDGETRTLLKFTMPQTTFAPAAGTKVQVTATQQDDKYGNITYKIDSKPESFVLLDQNNKEKQTSGLTKEPASTVVAYSSANTHGGGGTGKQAYDANGQKRGNAITNAVSLLIASKETATKDKLLKLARLVYGVSTELENNPNNEETAKNEPEAKQPNPFD